MTFHPHSTALALAIAALAAVACGSAQSSESLDRGLQRYNEAVRWHRVSEAAQYLPPPRRDDYFHERLAIEDDLRITRYDIRRVDRGEDEERAVAYVQYAWYLDGEGTVHETVTEQTWRRHGDGWLLVDEVRAHGEPMPGVVGPEAGDDGPAEGGGDDGGDAASLR